MSGADREQRILASLSRRGVTASHAWWNKLLVDVPVPSSVVVFFGRLDQRLQSLAPDGA